MKIAIDAMGGDFAPSEIVKGAIQAVHEYDVDVILIGQEELVNKELVALCPEGDKRITVVHADEVVAMDDAPSQIIRKKRNSSLHVGLDLVKTGEAKAFFSAGNTGAVMAVSILKLRTLDGIDRPGIATALPSLSVHGHAVLIDAGANVDSKAQNYLHFAIMGSAYAKSVLHIDAPTVGLLSIGEEDSKGNETTKLAFNMLKACKAINFIGNVEAKELYKGKADVIVCDGFAGNIALKTSESVAYFMGKLLKDVLTGSLLGKIGSLFLLPGLKKFKRRVNYEEYGGAPLLGVGGICVIGHGSSSANAVKNAIRVSKEMVEKDLNGIIEQGVGEARKILDEAVLTSPSQSKI